MGLGRDPVLPLSLQKLKTQSYWKEREFLLKDCTVWRGWNRNDWERGERDSLVPRKTVPVVSQRQSDGVKQWERCFNGWKQWETDTWEKNWMDATRQNRGTITASSHSLTLSLTHTHLSLSQASWLLPGLHLGGVPKLSSSCPWGVPKKEVWVRGGEGGWKAQGSGCLPALSPVC